MNPFFSVMMGGILPFGAVFIELFFILSSVWSHQFYYLFSFLFLVFLILVITCAEISIVMCYFQLCSEVRTSFLFTINHLNNILANYQNYFVRSN